MNLFKVEFLFEPRVVLKYKDAHSKKLTDWFFGMVSESMKDELIFKMEDSFNGITALVVSSESSVESKISDLCDTFDKEVVGDVSVSVESISYDTAMGLACLSDTDKASVKAAVGDGYVQKTPTADLNVGDNAPSDTSSQKEADQTTSEESDVFADIRDLVGLDEFKEWASKMEAIFEKKLPDSLILKTFMNMSYLVSVNPGNGSSTIFDKMAKVIAKVLHKKSSEMLEYKSFCFGDENKKGTDDDILSKLKYFEEGGDKLYVITLWADDFLEKRAQWLNFLAALRRHRSKAVFIFAAPYLENSTLTDMHSVIEDIMPNTVLSIKPMKIDDYIRLFDIYFEKSGLKVDEEVHSYIPDMIAQENADGRFYGINTINKICDEVAYIKISNITSGLSDNVNVIGVEDVKPFINNFDDSDEKTAMDKLEGMISLGEVKAKIKEIIAAVKMQRKLNPDSPSSMHMMFSGSPGTGKTVVARLIGQIFRENNILSLGGFYEVSRKDLVGRYIGSTAPKTAEICRLAYGGVLFIDEAYLLDGGGEQDYGKEAIGTLIAEMENKRSNLVVIFAGYEKDLEKLFSLNPGLRDRIPYRINFPNYNREELKQIFYKMIPQKFAYQSDFSETVDEYFDNFSEDILSSANFSNGRFVRNLVERVISKASMRMQLDEGAELSLVKSDFMLASSDGEFSKLNTKKTKERTIGY